jgi:signal-transduction protein with cAMP-binding, CBS, and nucleotidyltransferase domain
MRYSLGDIVATGCARTLTLDAQTSVRRAVQLMNYERAGVVLVTSRNRLVGIVTERDVLRRIVDREGLDLGTPLAEVMTSPVHCAPQHITADDAIRLLSELDHRHLVVVENGIPIGVVSIGDLMSVATRELEQSVIDLATFISGPAATVDLPSKVFGSRPPGAPGE